MMRTLAMIVVLCLIRVVPATASTPLDYTRTILQQARAIVGDNETHNEKLAALSVLFDKFLDSDAMGRQALGLHWASFTSEQQRDFLALFRELLERTYVDKLLLFESPDFVYAGQQLTGSGAIVDTKIVTPRDQFDVSYTLRPSDGDWRATGIAVEDVSLIANLSSQLNDLLNRMSTDDLLALMRRKYGKPGGGAQS
jgi:phospholipid transport system substrate-binding protein